MPVPPAIGSDCPVDIFFDEGMAVLAVSEVRIRMDRRHVILVRLREGMISLCGPRLPLGSAHFFYRFRSMDSACLCF
jgi:hypothetical protein